MISLTMTTAGTDSMPLAEVVANDTIKPKRVKKVLDLSYRTFYIKKKNGKTRKICAPSADLLKAQRRILPELVEHFTLYEAEHLKSEIFHGFIPGRNIVTCAELHKNLDHTLTLDISNCFDSISNEMIASCDIKPLDIYFEKETNCLAQGFATSPILSAIYLVKPIKELITLVKYIDPEAVVTCYADDIQISIHKQSYDTLNRLVTYATHIFAQYKLTINPKKTRMRHSKYGNRKILGIQVGSESLTPSRKLKKKIRAAKHQGNGPSLGGLVTASRMMLPRILRKN